jgi:hypothetical protein
MNPRDAPIFHHIHLIFFTAKITTARFFWKPQNFTAKVTPPIFSKQIQNPNPLAPRSSRSDSQTNAYCPEEVDGGKTSSSSASSSSVFSHYNSTLQLLYSDSQVGFMFIPIGKIDPGQTQSFSLTAPETVGAMGPQLASGGFRVNLWGFFRVNLASGFDWIWVAGFDLGVSG